MGRRPSFLEFGRSFSVGPVTVLTQAPSRSVLYASTSRDGHIPSPVYRRLAGIYPNLGFALAFQRQPFQLEGRPSARCQRPDSLLIKPADSLA